MSGEIEAVIARSRTKGRFKGEKGHFSLAHQKAKTKVSEYALPDRSFFCLELIQSAVAIGARYIDIRMDAGSFVLSFVGGHYPRSDLEYLFDYLLTTRQEDDFRALRRLAIGVSSALSGPGSQVVIETGDGTAEGSTRFELTDIEGQALIGAPRAPIAGTFVRVNRRGGGISSALEKLLPNLDGDPVIASQVTREEAAITERCLDLPVPIVLNGDVLGSYAPTRGMVLHRFKHSVPVDEHDLHGGLGISPRVRYNLAEIKVLTNGVWITSITREDLPEGLHGVIGYERLHKTASQYEIVVDDRVEEMVQRLRPYVYRLCHQMGMETDACLGYMFSPQLPDPGGEGEPWSTDLVSEDGPWARLELRLVPDGEPGVDLHVVWTDHHRTLDHVRLPHAIPLAGVMSLHVVEPRILRFRRTEDPHWDPMHVVGLAPQIYEAVGAHLEASRADLEAHLEGRWPPPRTEERVARIARTSSISALPPLPEALRAELEALAERDGEDPPEPLPAAPLPRPQPRPEPEDVMDVSEELPQEPPTETPDPPGIEEMRTRIAGADGDEALHEAVADLLARVMVAAPVHAPGRDLLAEWRQRIDFVSYANDDPVVARWVEDADQSPGDWPPPIPRTSINVAHPLIARWLRDLHVRPEHLYGLAVLVFDAFDRLHYRDLAAEEMRFQDRLLARLD